MDQDGESSALYLDIELPALDGDPEAEFTRLAILASLQKALEELPANQREVFVSHEVGRGVLILAAIAVLWLIVMLLWNAIVPGVFPGIQNLDYRQALCLLVLSRILFGGFGSRGGRPGRRGQRLENLTPEERARFRRGDCRPSKEAESGS